MSMKHDPQKRGTNGRFLKTDFWDHVQKTRDGCWIWQGAQNQGKWNYGQFRHATEGMAHRVAWTLTYGEIPSGFLILHQCDNPPCVNPNHLFLGTAQDNMQDAIRKGRFVYHLGFGPGENALNVKLTWERVRQIRQLYANGISQYAIAREFCLHQSNVSYIVNNKTWKE